MDLRIRYRPYVFNFTVIIIIVTFWFTFIIWVNLLTKVPRRQKYEVDEPLLKNN